jgi:hypothetical protein
MFTFLSEAGRWYVGAFLGFGPEREPVCLVPVDGSEELMATAGPFESEPEARAAGEALDLTAGPVEWDAD